MKFPPATHHHLVDARGITMHWTGKPVAHGGDVGHLLESGWSFTDARGRRIGLPEAVEPRGTAGSGALLGLPAPPPAEAA